MNESDIYSSMMFLDRALIDEWKSAHEKNRVEEAREKLTPEQGERINAILDFIKHGVALDHRNVMNKGGLFELKLTKLTG